MSNTKTDITSLIDKLKGINIAKLGRYALLSFILFVAALYGFVLFRINSLSNLQPSNQDVSSKVKAAQVPHIDQAIVSQLKSLQDNSVSVQTLFDQARSNPFQ